MHLRSRSLLVLAAFAVAGCTHQFRAVHDLTAHAQFATGTALEVTTDNGDVSVYFDPAATALAVTAKVVAHGRSEAEARDRARQIDVAIETEGGRVRVLPLYPGEREPGDGCSFEIRVPAASDLVVDTSNGGIRVEGCSAPARLDTSNGNVDVRGHVGLLVVDSSNGNLALVDVDGEVRAETSNGSIELRTRGDLVHAVTLASSNGNVTLEVAGEGTGSVRAQTSNGDLSVKTPDGTVRRDSGDGPLEHAFAQSGARHVLSTSNGNVTVRVGR